MCIKSPTRIGLFKPFDMQMLFKLLVFCVFVSLFYPFPLGFICLGPVFNFAEDQGEINPGGGENT